MILEIGDVKVHVTRKGQGQILCRICGETDPSKFEPRMGSYGRLRLRSKTECGKCRASRDNRHLSKHNRQKDRLKQYQMNQEDYLAMLARQNGVCYLCGLPPTDKQVLCVDHCHKTGVVRGLLCSACNLGLGAFRDNPEVLRKAADYIVQFKQA